MRYTTEAAHHNYFQEGYFSRNHKSRISDVQSWWTRVWASKRPILEGISSESTISEANVLLRSTCEFFWGESRSFVRWSAPVQRSWYWCWWQSVSCRMWYQTQACGYDCNIRCSKFIAWSLRPYWSDKNEKDGTKGRQEAECGWQVFLPSLRQRKADQITSDSNWCSFMEGHGVYWD